jgi:hypothetical protein
VNYSAARIAKGFEDLLKALAEQERPDEVQRRIRANTEARQAAQERVRLEYAALGCEPPSPDALSITARRELGMTVPDFVSHEMGEESAA